MSESINYKRLRYPLIYFVLFTSFHQFTLCQTTVIQRNEIWTDDFQHDTTKQSGWHLWGKLSGDYDKDEQIHYGENGKPYHGPLDKEFCFVCNTYEYNWLQRDFICAQNSDVYVSYSYTFCNMGVTSLFNLYTIDSTTDIADQYSFRSNQFDGYLSDIDPILISALTDESGLGLGPGCDGNIVTTWKYKEKKRVYIGTATKNISYTISFMVKSKYLQNTLIYDIIIQCDGHPTSHPTLDPTYDPTIDPTRTPTSNPSQNPSLNPTNSPTNSPSFSPIIAPSNAPSMNPSVAPTLFPTISPTNYPISIDNFNGFLNIKYELNKLKSHDTKEIFVNLEPTLSYVETLIKKWYFDEIFLKYQQFTVNVETINDILLNDINQNNAQKWNNMIIIGTNIKCNVLPINSCAFIKQQSQIDKTFAVNIQTELQSYFNNYDIEFNVLNPTDIQTKCKYPQDCITNTQTVENNVTNYALYGLGLICVIIIFIGICSLLYNKIKFPKCPGCNIVDDAKWTTVIVFSLQLWDFVSDILLSIEILTREDFNLDKDNILIIISGIGSCLFVIIPYLVNLWMAYKIKDFINNEAAKAWFQVNTPIFVGLVVIIGSCHTAISLVSSGIFGLKIMSSGLTQYEITKLGKMKIIGCVILENIPQLIAQIIYGFALNGKLTNVALLAGIASILSVISSILSYCIESNKSGTNVMQYYLKTYRGQTGETRNNYHLNEQEKKNIIDNRGRTQCLSENIAAAFGISPTNIEIGFSTITKDGIITHVVHYVYDQNLKIMQQEQSNNNNGNLEITPTVYIKQLYCSEKKEIVRIFREHFALNSDFNVMFDNKLSLYYTDSINTNKISATETMMVNISISTNRKLEALYDEVCETDSDNDNNNYNDTVPHSCK